MATHSSTSRGGVRPEQPGRDFGRDGISGLVTEARALRAREVSQPTAADYAAAEEQADALLERALRRRR